MDGAGLEAGELGELLLAGAESRQRLRGSCCEHAPGLGEAGASPAALDQPLPGGALEEGQVLARGSRRGRGQRHSTAAPWTWSRRCWTSASKSRTDASHALQGSPITPPLSCRDVLVEVSELGFVSGDLGFDEVADGDDSDEGVVCEYGGVADPTLCHEGQAVLERCVW